MNFLNITNCLIIRYHENFICDIFKKILDTNFQQKIFQQKLICYEKIVIIHFVSYFLSTKISQANARAEFIFEKIKKISKKILFVIMF